MDPFSGTPESCAWMGHRRFVLIFAVAGMYPVFPPKLRLDGHPGSYEIAGVGGAGFRFARQLVAIRIPLDGCCAIFGWLRSVHGRTNFPEED